MGSLVYSALLVLVSAAGSEDLVQRVTACDAVETVSAKAGRRFRVGPGEDCKELYVFYGLEGEAGGQRFIHSALANGFTLVEDGKGVELRGPKNKRPAWLEKAKQQCPKATPDVLVLGVQAAVTNVGKVVSTKLLGTKDVQESRRGHCLLKRAKSAPYQAVDNATTRYIYPVDNDTLGGLKLGPIEESPAIPASP